MRPFFFFFLSICLSSASVSLQAQSIAKEPEYDITILVDGKLVDLVKGVPAGAHTLNLTGQLTKNSIQEYPRLRSEVAINKATISLLRNNKKVDSVDWTGNESLATLSQQAQAGDQYVIQFDTVSTQTKNGVIKKLNIGRLYSIALY